MLVYNRRPHHLFPWARFRAPAEAAGVVLAGVASLQVVNRCSSATSVANPPWRLLTTSVLLGLALASMGLEARLSTPVLGRAQLRQTLPPGQSGWQAQLDLVALRLGSVDVAAERLFPLLGLSPTPNARNATAAPAAGSPKAAPATGSNAELITFQQLGQAKVTAAVDEVPDVVLTEDAVFGGSPVAVWEWTGGATVLRGNLYRKNAGSGLLSGRIVGTLPLSGIVAGSGGFQLEQLRYLPDDLDSLVVIDPTILRFAPHYRDKIQKEWDRWEFFPLTRLRGALGTTLAYARWHGEPLFFISLADRPAMEKEIAERFPEAVIPGTVRRAFGARIRGFEPDGPAWTFRGDTLVASKTGGPQRLEALLRQAMGDRSFRKPQALRKELQRLAQETDFGGWHAMLLFTDPEAPLHWGALLRWPEPGLAQVTGYLVMQPNRVTPRPAPAP